MCCTIVLSVACVLMSCLIYVFLLFLSFFFFSSRRRHTRCLSDWSSDVCSSDLAGCGPAEIARYATGGSTCSVRPSGHDRLRWSASIVATPFASRSPCSGPGHTLRSEERRVGKEGRCGWAWEIG